MDKCSQCGRFRASVKDRDFGHGFTLPTCEDCIDELNCPYEKETEYHLIWMKAFAKAFIKALNE